MQVGPVLKSPLHPKRPNNVLTRQLLRAHDIPLTLLDFLQRFFLWAPQSGFDPFGHSMHVLRVNNPDLYDNEP